MTATRTIGALVAVALALAAAVRVVGVRALPVQPQSSSYELMAGHIVRALKVAPGERVMLRVDRNTMPELEPIARAALERAGAQVETLVYGPAADFDERLARTDVYVWLPAPAFLTGEAQRSALARWVDQGGSRREIHFHWSDGTRNLDAMPAPHTAEHDRLYFDALEIDYDAMRAQMSRAIALLSSGEVRVTTPAGTDIRFRTGNRPFNRQDGDGSSLRVSQARMRIDRHIELPAGILRVAPVEDSISGVIGFAAFYPSSTTRASRVRLEFERGRIVKVSAADGQADLEAWLASNAALSRFREFCVGFNPRLVMKPGDSVVPYYGYGAGVVRLSLGDNEELAGAVRGGAVRWNFFADATVEVSGQALVKDGRLVLPPR
jgi:hypothetical protein